MWEQRRPVIGRKSFRYLVLLRDVTEILSKWRTRRSSMWCDHSVQFTRNLRIEPCRSLILRRAAALMTLRAVGSCLGAITTNSLVHEAPFLNLYI